MYTFLKDCLKEIARQVFGVHSQSNRTGKLVLTKHALRKMYENRLTKRHIRDTFARGELVKENMIIREYNGYAIGLLVKYDAAKNQQVLLSCWKRKSWK